MAERRMFAKSIIGSARFLKMPPSARLLYYDLGMAADDDGCVEAFGVMRMTGAAEDDLRVLHAKGFVKILNEDLVSYISDWTTNNTIRKDRYHEGIYHSLLNKMCPVCLQNAQSATTWQPTGNQPTTKRQPLDNQTATEERVGKVRLGEVSIGESEERDENPPPPKNLIGRFKNVSINKLEVKALEDEFGKKAVEAYIDKLSGYIKSTGKHYESHTATIWKWLYDDCNNKLLKKDLKHEEQSDLMSMIETNYEEV